MGSERFNQFFVLADDGLTRDGGTISDSPDGLPDASMKRRFPQRQRARFFSGASAAGAKRRSRCGKIVKGQDKNAHARIRN